MYSVYIYIYIYDNHLSSSLYLSLSLSLRKPGPARSFKDGPVRKWRRSAESLDYDRDRKLFREPCGGFTMLAQTGLAHRVSLSLSLSIICIYIYIYMSEIKSMHTCIITSQVSSGGVNVVRNPASVLE